MAVESDDPQKEQEFDPQRDGPHHPERLYQSIGWSDNQSLPAQQQSAQRAFEHNSEILQRQALADKAHDRPEQTTQEPDHSSSPVPNRDMDETRDYHSLKVEHAKAAVRDERDDDELTFLRDRKDKSKEEPSRDDPNELTFLRDRSSPDRSPSR